MSSAMAEGQQQAELEEQLLNNSINLQEASRLAPLCCLACCLLLQSLSITFLALCCCQAVLILGFDTSAILPLLSTLTVNLTLVSTRHVATYERED
jgi:hypothetical protein